MKRARHFSQGQQIFQSLLLQHCFVFRRKTMLVCLLRLEAPCAVRGFTVWHRIEFSSWIQDGICYTAVDVQLWVYCKCLWISTERINDKAVSLKTRLLLFLLLSSHGRHHLPLSYSTANLTDHCPSHQVARCNRKNKSTRWAGNGPAGERKTETIA